MGEMSKVREALHRVVPEAPQRALRDGASLVDDLGLDSLKIAELSMVLEQVFDWTHVLHAQTIDVLASIKLTNL